MIAMPPARGIDWLLVQRREIFRTAGVRKRDNRKETEPRKTREYMSYLGRFLGFGRPLSRLGQRVVYKCATS
jgi:hypothetical protein